MKLFLNYVEGFVPFEKTVGVGLITNHPGLIFFDEEEGKFYIFNLTSNDQSMRNNVNHCFATRNGQRLEVYAQDVYVKDKFYTKYAMNLTCTCAVVDEVNVSWKNQIKSGAFILINQKYVCKNYKQLVNDCLNLIYDYTDQVICYDGNISLDGSTPATNRLEDDMLPEKVFAYIENIVDPLN